MIPLTDWRWRRLIVRQGRGRREFVEHLERLVDFRLALDAWNAAQGGYRIPQSRDFAIDLPNIRPAAIYFDRRAEG